MHDQNNCSFDDVSGDAVRVLTEAARLRRPRARSDDMAGDQPRPTSLSSSHWLSVCARQAARPCRQPLPAHRFVNGQFVVPDGGQVEVPILR